MKRLFLLLLFLPLLLPQAHAQGYRVESSVTTSATNVPVGAQAPVLTVPYSTITVCAYPASGSPCTNTAAIYSDQALTQVLMQPVATDSQGRYGFWVSPGTYSYSVVSVADVVIGNFAFTVGAGGGGGSGTVSSGTAGQLAQYQANGTVVSGATVSGDATMTTGGVLTLGAVNTNVGSCGDATHVSQITLDAKGRATGCTAVTISAAGGINQLTGDATAGPGTGSVPISLVSVNAGPGSYTSANITVDSKGRVTAASNGTGGGISALTGPVTASGTGSVPATITATGVTPGTYNFGSQVLTVNAAGQITAAGTPFSATFGCTQCGTYETGYAGITSVSGTISYANPSVPTSASVSDGTNTDTLSTPFTSWTLSHTYTTNTCFTLTAVGGGQTVTPQQCIGFLSRTFGGVGTAGATGATASGTNAVLAGATGTLSSAGLSNQASYGPFSPVSQKIYVLMLGGSHTFTSGGFNFPMNSPTPVSFVNQNGATVAMFLYESTSTFASGTFSLLVASFMFFPFLRKRSKYLASLCLLSGSAFAQVQLGGPPYAPVTGNSSLGNTVIAMTDATCDILSPGSTCTVTANNSAAAPWYRNLYLTGTLSSGQSLVLPLGGDYVLHNATGQTVTAGGTSGTTVAVANDTTVEVNSADGANYVQVGSSGGLTSFQGRTTSAAVLTTSDVNGVGAISNNTSGNSATSTQLAATPPQCPGSTPYSTGITANGTPLCVSFASIGITPGAIADYNFLQVAGSPSLLKDYSGNGNDGTLGSGANAPQWATTGLFFDNSLGQFNTRSVTLPAALNNTRTFIFVTQDDFLPSGQSAGQNYNLILAPTVATDTALIDTKFTLSVASQSHLASSLLIAKSGSLTTVSAQTDNGFHCRAYTQGVGGGDNDHLYVDGIEQQYQNQGASYSPLTSGNFFLGAGPSSPFNTSSYYGTMYRAIFYNSELTQSEIQSTCGGMFGDVNSRGVSTVPVVINGATPQLLAIGDSITCGWATGSCFTNTPYSSLLSLTNQPTYAITNFGNPGAPLQSMAAQEQFRVAPRCYSTAGTSIATVLAGINDIMGNVPTTATSLLPYLYTEVAALKAGGCKVYVGTLVANTQNAAAGGTADAMVEAYDALIAEQWEQMGADGIIDFQANPLMGAAGAAANGTYFETDGVHPTQAGQQQMANAESNSLNYYYGYKASSPHLISASSYQMLSGDGGVELTGTASQTLTLPDCTGPTGAVYTVTNPTTFTSTVVGGSSQPISGSSSPVNIAANSAAQFKIVANPRASSGCHWIEIPTYNLGGTLSSSDVSLGTGAGSGASLTNVIGLDGTHEVILLTGTSPVQSATIYTLTFTTSRGHATNCTLSASDFANINSFAQIPAMLSNSDTSYGLQAGTTALDPSTNYVFTVSCP